MEHHRLYPYSIPKEEPPIFVNEPWLIDKQLFEYTIHTELEECDDNVRIYLPMDLNKNAILRRLDGVIACYGEANEENEFNFCVEVNELISQVEIYDQVWYTRHMPDDGKHSKEAIALVKEFVSRLEQIPDGCAECFPFDEIDVLKKEYLD